MVSIPLALWMTVAEAAGAAVLAAWRRIRPLIVRAWRLLVAAERIAERRVTPKWAVATVSVAALVVLAASQWVDYREISVGNFAYGGGVENIAPAPDVATDRAGDAHSWVMVPIAALGLVLVVASVTGRWRAARLLAGLGVAGDRDHASGRHAEGPRRGQRGDRVRGREGQPARGLLVRARSAARR